jgi:apolipoprotein N-acyltransferase
VTSNKTQAGGSLKFLVLLFVGVLTATSTAWPTTALLEYGQPQWQIQVFGLSVFCWCLDQSPSPRAAFVTGLWFSTAWLAATFWWLFVAMHTYGGLHPVLSVIAVILLAAALSLYYASAASVYWKLRVKNPLLSSALFGLLWTGAELARGTWFTGFGWSAIGYAHVDGPLRALIPWTGMYGVGAICAAFAMLTAQAGKLTRKHAFTLLVACVALTAIPGGNFSTSTGRLSVTLLQGNIPQNEKFEAGSGVPAALAWYAAQQNAATTDLVVSPETAIPLLPQELPTGYWEALNAKFSVGNTALLTGIPLGDYNAGYTNSVIGISPHQPTGWHYDKHHLVPFGEFIPALFKWFTRMMNIPLGDFNRGALGQASFERKGQRLAPNICYEDLFGEELAVRFLDTERAPSIFVNVSNLGWFGDTIAIDQHLQISRMRALEFERPFVRATNTGATVIIDHQGNITASIPKLTQGVLVGELEGRAGITPYAWWVSRFALWPFWVLISAAVGLAWRSKHVGAR